MAKKHDEKRDVMLLNRIAGISVSKNEILVSVNAKPGIHALGKIDYLTHYCGYIVKKVE